MNEFVNSMKKGIWVSYVKCDIISKQGLWVSLLISVVSYLQPECDSRLAWISAVEVHSKVFLTFNSHATLQS